LLAFIFSLMFSLSQPKLLLTSFLLPVYGIANLFRDSQVPDRDWSGSPDIFGVPIHPILFSLVLQSVVGIFLWRATVRKTANPFQLLFRRTEALTLFAVLMAAQQGLMWALWRGEFGNTGSQGHDRSSLLPVVHGATILLGVMILAVASPQPERVRVEALRLGFKSLSAAFSRSATSLAFALAAAAAALLFTQCALSIAVTWRMYLVACVNLLALFLMFSLLLEFCRLRFRRRALGFVALFLFVLCVLPFVLAGVFSSEPVAQWSFLAPGIVALANPKGDDWSFLVRVTLGHLAIVLLLFIVWRNQWSRLLRKASPAPSTASP
jgi:hypothetical protein